MLDDLEKIKSIDRQNMLDIVMKFPENIEKSVKIEELNLNNFNPHNIIITGMGGSAIGGDIVASLLFDRLKVPIFINRGYHLPAFVSNKSLVICVSYSGNTEETLSCFNEALDKKSKIISITSNGQIEKLCNENNILHIKVLKGIPPRAALPNLLFSIIALLQKLKLINLTDEIKETIEILKKIRKEISPEINTNSNKAKQIAKSINGTYPVIYGHSLFSPIAKRWRTQFNENSKIIASDYEFVETNHNDIVGWENVNKKLNFSIIIFREKNEEEIVSKRINLLKKMVYEKKAKNVIEIFAEGDNKLARMLSILYIGDFVSIYLAILNNIDPTPVYIIEKLKKELVR